MKFSTQMPEFKQDPLGKYVVIMESALTTSSALRAVKFNLRMVYIT